MQVLGLTDLLPQSPQKTQRKIYKFTPSVFSVGSVVIICLLLYILPVAVFAAPVVKLGIDRLVTEEYSYLLKGKRIGLITNQTGVNSSLISTVDVLKAYSKTKSFSLVALFAPEHGINGSISASQTIEDAFDADHIPIYSLYGKNMRPTGEMLKGIDLLIYDIQDIGSRSYTYVSTMFYAMEACAKNHVQFCVLDRPNPINGVVVDGLLLDKKHRSTIGYVNVPYCHGMTAGELARYFNQEYNIGCQLIVIPMRGWSRKMTFKDTGLSWIPTSPYIPEATTAYFYPTTGILGELQIVNTGLGYTMPFKIVGAPWIDAILFADQLNAQAFPGVFFRPFYFTPNFGRHAKEACQGVLIVVTDPSVYKPVSTQFLLIGLLKSLYPAKFKDAVNAAKKQKSVLCTLLGNEEAYRILTEEKHIAWKLCGLQSKERSQFLSVRKKYLLDEYGSGGGN